MVRMAFLFFCTALLNPPKSLSQLRFEPAADSSRPFINIWPMPQNFYKPTLGFFCKKEVQIQKATGLPLFFRLGSKEYVDYLERKNKVSGRAELQTVGRGQ